MANEDVTPIGLRLGSERLYDENLPNLEPVEAPPPPAPKRRIPKGKRRKLPPPPAPELAVAPKRADVNWPNITSNALELLGIAAITAGCAMIAAWLAFVVGGILLCVLGVAIGMNVTM